MDSILLGVFQIDLTQFSSGSIFAWIELLGICKSADLHPLLHICTVQICRSTLHLHSANLHSAHLLSADSHRLSPLGQNPLNLMIDMSFNWSRLHAKANIHWNDWVICEFTTGHLLHPSYYHIRHIHHTITDALFTTLSMLCICTFCWSSWFSCQLIVSTLPGNSTLMDHKDHHTGG